MKIVILAETIKYQNPIKPKQHFLTFILGFLITTVSAQQFVIDGQVVHAFGDDLENIHIYNSTTSQGSLTTKDGKFKLTVSVRDTVVVSAVQFLTINEVITQEHYLVKTIVFELKESRTELDEVLIKNHNLSGDLERDGANIKTEPEISALSMGIIKREIKPLTKSERELFTATEGWEFALAVPLHTVINAISGRAKKLKHRVKLERDNKAIEELLVLFPPIFFQDQLEISEEKLYDFLFFCEADPLFRETIGSHKLRVMDFLIIKAQKFKQLQSGEE